MVLGLFIRVGRCYLEDSMNPDSISYITMSKYIAQGKIRKAIEIRPELPPLYITLMAAMEKTGLSAEHAGRLISLISGTLVILAIFLIAAMIFDEKIALAAAFLGAIQCELVEASTHVLREMSALCFMLFGLYFLFSVLKNHACWKWCIAGILSGLCALTRPDGIEILLAIPVWLVISFIFYPVERRNISTKCLPGFILFIVLFLAVVVPVQHYFQYYGSTYTALLDSKMLRIYMGI